MGPGQIIKNQINLDLIEIIQFCLKIYDLLTHPHLWVVGGLIYESMKTTWRQHEDNVETTWDVGTTGMWRPCGDNMETTWGQCGDHGDVETTWGQHGDHMETT